MESKQCKTVRLFPTHKHKHFAQVYFILWDSHWLKQEEERPIQDSVNEFEIINW